METLPIKHFMPTEKMYKDMVENEVTYFHRHNNTRFTISSRLIPRKGLWVNFFRAAPYLYLWSRAEEKILPEHYKARCREYMTREPEPVHWIPSTEKYRHDKETGERFPVINAPIPVIYPEECNKGLWGGEGIIFGYYRKTNPKKVMKRPTSPRIWRPYIKKQVLYSEILNRYMSVNVTLRALYLIDESFGLDFYILKTHEVDLCSKFAMELKREMLLSLAQRSMYPDDPAKNDRIFKKYSEFVIPEEEAEWVGLTVWQAVEKAEKLDAETNQPQPLKNLHLVELIKKLKFDTAVPVSGSS